MINNSRHTFVFACRIAAKPIERHSYVGRFRIVFTGSDRACAYDAHRTTSGNETETPLSRSPELRRQTIKATQHVRYSPNIYVRTFAIRRLPSSAAETHSAIRIALHRILSIFSG